jgi:hypothetical protein
MSLRKFDNERTAVAVGCQCSKYLQHLGEKIFHMMPTHPWQSMDFSLGLIHFSPQVLPQCELTTNLVCCHVEVNLIAAKNVNHVIEVRNATVLG